MNKKIIYTSILVFLTLIFSSLSFNGFSQTVWDGTSADVSWYNATDTEFEISTAAELAGLAQLVNGGNTFSGKTVNLISNVWLNADESTDNNWTPIGGVTTSGEGTPTYTFGGTFNGNNNVIYNLYCNKTGYKVGFFGAISTGATLKNIILVDAYVQATAETGTLLGWINASAVTTVEKCMSINAYTKVSIGDAGALIGKIGSSSTTNSKVKQCMATGTSDATAWSGGLVGVSFNTTFTDCYFGGKLNSDYNAGGITGHSGSNVLNNCYSYLDPTGSQTGTNGKSGTIKTLAEMQSDAFLDLLNTSGDYYQADCAVNGGLPILEGYACNILISGLPEVCAGTQVTLTAQNGFETYEWKANGTVIQGQTGNTITYTVNATTTFSAKSVRVEDDFELEGEFTVTVLPNFTFTGTVAASYDGEVHGTVAPTTSSIACTNPSNINYTITPATGWYVTKVLVDGEEIDFTEGVNNVVTGTYTPTAGKHGNVTAHFYDKYKITTTLTLDGASFPNTTLVTPWGTNGVVEVLKGTNQAFEISQTNVYSINSIKVNGELVAMSTNYTFENVQSDQTLEVDYRVDVVAGQVWDGTVDTDWYNTTETEFYIFTPEQLAGVANIVNTTTEYFANKKIILMADIWLNENEDSTNNWMPIGVDATATSENAGSRSFRGTFDGNGHIIYNLYCDRGINYQGGLIGNSYGGVVIEKLGLINPIVKGRGLLGGILGNVRYSSGTATKIQNCMVINARIASTNGNNNGTIVGGTFNNSGGRTKILSCLGTGNVSSNHSGGIVGNGNYSDIENCYFYGTLSGVSPMGGLSAYKGNGTAANSYANIGEGASGVVPTGVLTLDQMLSPLFLEAINADLEVPAFKIDCGINQGLPIMDWYVCAVDITGPTEVCANTEITLNANGYDTYTWKHNLNDTFEATGESLTFTVEEDMVFTVIGKLTAFPDLEVVTDYEVTVNEKMNITVNIRAYDNGIHGTVDPMIEEINCGSSTPVTFAITPDAGWHISEILINGEHERGSDHTDGAIVNFAYQPEDISANIEVHFSDEYFVTASIGLQGGTDLDAPYLINNMTKDSKVYGKSGEDLTITFNETGKYHIVDVIVNNENKGRLSSYTFANLDRDSHTIRVVYEEECGILSIPYYENFDFYGTGKAVAPDCWTYLDSQDANNNGIELSSAQYSSAGASLLMTSSTGQGNFTLVQLPEFSEDIMNDDLNNLQVRFKLYTTNANVSLEVGFAFFDMTQIPPVWQFDTITVVTPTEMGEWDEFEVSLAGYTPTTLRKLSFKVEGKSATGTNGLYIDDLVIDYLPTCPRPTNIALNDVDGDYVVISWDKGATEDNWEVVVVERGELPSTGTPIVKATNENVRIEDLNPLTEYDAYVRAICDVDEISIWSKPFKFKTPQILAHVPYKCDFENASENANWEFKSDKTPNKWYVGDVVNNGGENALYISGDGGETNKSSTWTTNINGTYVYYSYVYAFRTISIDEAGSYTYSYDWRNKGYSTYYGYIRVLLAPESVSFNGGSSAPTSSDITRIDGNTNLYNQENWQTITGDITITEPGNYNLIFYYYNYYYYNGDAYQPAAAIDNVIFRSTSSPLAEIDPNNLIDDTYPTCLNRTEQDAKEVLPETVELKTEEGFIFTTNITWTITGYDSSEVGNTAVATGTFTLPVGVVQTDPPTELVVTKSLYVNALPVLTCPANTNTSVNDELELTEGTPGGGFFSGIGVTGNIFDPVGLEQGDHDVVYTYTDPLTTCVNECTFTVAITYNQISAVDIDNEVEPIIVCEGTTISEAIERLEQDIMISDSEGAEREVLLTWTIADYDPEDVEGVFTATGTFELPTGVLPNDDIDLEVTTTVTIRETPILTCPVIGTVLVNSGTIDLAAEGDQVYTGGTFVGASVLNNIFNPANLTPGTYTMAYNYNEYATNCSNTCMFTITVEYPTVEDVDLDNILLGSLTKCAGTPTNELISLLPSSMRIEDSEGATHTVSISGWTINGYDPESTSGGTYTAEAVYSLGSLKLSGEGLNFNVTKEVVILEIPEMTCPDVITTTTNSFVVLTGAIPEGGVYSGTNVTDGVFNPKGLFGDYTITYTKSIESAGVTCSNSCSFTITVTYPEIEEVDYTSIVPEEKQFCVGTEKAEIIDELPTTIVIRDSDNIMHDVTLTWDIADYESSVAEDYTAVGTFDLPSYMLNSLAVPLKVETSIVLNALPLVTCPEGLSVISGNKLTLTGSTPIGGTYSGTNVSGFTFDATSLSIGTYAVTYSYTDPATGCDNSCTFNVDVVGAQIGGIDVENAAQPVEVCLGTPEAEVKAQLVSQIKISDSNGNNHTVSLTWTITGYNPEVAEIYEAIGTFTLPAGISQTTPATDLKVRTKVYVKELPQIICSGTMKTEVNSVLSLEGSALPLGGEYSGEHVSNGKFNSEGLNPGNYTVTYTYTDPVTGCSNSCDFTITIVIGIELNLYENISIYPNPTAGDFNIDFGSYEGVASYVIYDTKGSVIKEENLHKVSGDVKEVSLNVQPGVYYIKLVTNGESIVKQIVID